MKQITKLKDIAGLTVKHARGLDFDEYIGIVFEEDCYVVLEGYGHYEDSKTMVCDDDLNLQNKLELGVITQREYADIQEDHRKQAEKNKIARENDATDKKRELYEQLKREFGDV